MDSSARLLEMLELLRPFATGIITEVIIFSHRTID